MTHLKNINILLVEDDLTLSFLQTKLLESYGYTVCHVSTGEDAIQNIQEMGSDFQIILMDIDLGPGIDGTVAAEKILQIKDIPILFVLSHTEPEVVEKTEKITSYGYVVKNTGIVVLDASIKMALKLFTANQKIKNVLGLYKKSTHSLHQAQQISKFGSWEWNLKTGEIIWSDELYEIYDVDKNTFIPTIEEYSKFIHPEDVTLIEKMIDDILTKGISVNIVLRNIINNKIVYLNTIADVIEYDSEGKPEIMLGVNQDITGLINK